MFPVTITLHNPAQLNAVLAAMGGVKAVETLESKLQAAVAAQTDTKKAKTDPKPDAAPDTAPTPTASASSESSSTESTPVASADNAQPAADAPTGAAPDTGTTAQSAEAQGATYEDAKRAVLEVSKTRGRGAAVEMLQRFGVTKLPDLLPEHFGALVDHANEILTGAEV